MEWLQIEPLLSVAADQIARYSHRADKSSHSIEH
jgi:hypothetical protein